MRNRSSAFSMTTNTKMRISKELIEGEKVTENDKLAKFSEIIENKLKEENRLKPYKPFVNSNFINLPTPQYLDIKKEYYSKDEKAFKLFIY